MAKWRETADQRFVPHSRRPASRDLSYVATRVKSLGTGPQGRPTVLSKRWVTVRA